MKKKKIVALLLATSVMATSPALFTSPMMVFAEESEGTNLEVTAETSGEQIEVNTETIATNNSTIVTNEGTIETNEGSVTTNEGTITTNNGSGMFEDVRQDTSLNVNEATGDGIKYNNGDVVTNQGDILINNGNIETNTGNVLINDSNGTIENNNNEIMINHGTVTDNSGTIEANESGGTVITNNGEVTTNFGTIETNEEGCLIETNVGKVTTNEGGLLENNAIVKSNESTGDIVHNYGSVINNHGTVKVNATDDGWDDGGWMETNYSTVEDNEAWIYMNEGTIDVNNGFLAINNGTVSDNNRLIGTNHKDVTITVDSTEDGVVQDNRGTVEIIIENDATDDEIESIAKFSVPKNTGEVIIKNSDDEILTKYWGIKGWNGLTEDDYFQVYLDSIKENDTFTLSIPSGYGVDGNIILSKDSTTLAVIGDTLETNEDGDYIVPVGTKFKVTGCGTFLGKWYKIIQSTGAFVEVVRDTDSSDEAPKQETPVIKDFSSNIAGVDINTWEDVSDVMKTVANTLTPELNSDVKLFKLELSQKQLTIPTSVISSLTTSQVDGLHCFIGGGNAITFVDNGTLDNYVSTDFTHSVKETDNMKVIEFEKPQAIGATVIFSTRIPIPNKHVAIWMLVDGKYELVDAGVSNSTGNIAFPISSTGQFVLTY